MKKILGSLDKPDWSGGWNYRLVSLDKGSKTSLPRIGIYEVYYDNKGKIIASTEEPEVGYFDNREDLIAYLETLLKDAKRSPITPKSKMPKWFK